MNVTRSDLPADTDVTALLDPVGGKPGIRSRRPEITLHQLRIFWAVAHSETLTRAAKHLGLAQPSLSEQLLKLEATMGARLFHRNSNEMTLTEAGAFLLPRAEQILRNMQDLEDSFALFTGAERVTTRIAGISSVLRVILPAAIAEVQEQFPKADFDIQESAPADIVELLYSRRIDIGLVAANSIARTGIGFNEVPIVEDPYVLVVPAAVELDDVADVTALPCAMRAILDRSIQFTFGSQHARRVAEWYDRMLPAHRVVAQCRSFEVAIGLVRAGSGVCLAPALSTISGGNSLDGVRLYRVNIETRRIVALVGQPHDDAEPGRSLLTALRKSAKSLAMPAIRPTPPFLDRDGTYEL